MGMYTRHFIKIIESDKNTPENRAKLMKAITDNNEYDWTDMFREIPDSDGILTDEHINFGSGPKWYNYEYDILKISEALGEIELYVYGDYEHEDVVWEKQYYNGKLIREDYMNTWDISKTEDIVNYINYGL